jgi:hypothetical protein
MFQLCGYYSRGGQRASMTEQPRVQYDDLEVGDDQLMFWEGRPFSGFAVENYPDGNLQSETSFVNGLQEGVSRVWHPNGQLAEEALSWKGVRHGRSAAWTADGKPLNEEVYELGALVRGKYFGDDGTIARTFSIDPNDSLLLAYRKAYGKSAPPV